jgi:alkanesulfonate monooxygenase SsuD/methylene tetrahydromethanopterin reductase-like flavin-dependent oxidoreductase (luciferase family)
VETVPNPIFGPNAFKFGVFNANCDGGLTISVAPERWRADWDDIVEISRLADKAGIEFILPVAKWRGLGGDANVLGRSYETMTHSAAIGALTKRIGVFSTVHVPLVSPAFAAKAIATIDHVTHGRAALNIVCGWNREEFDIHGATIDGERRYEQGLEWFRIYAKILEGGPPFDWDGEFYKLRGLATDPLTVQRPRPPIMSAGFSPKGRDFAAQAADILFTNFPDFENGPAIVKSVHDYAAKYRRRIAVYGTANIVCRPTRTEAEEFYTYFAEEKADRKALEYFMQQKGATAGSDSPQASRPLANRFARATGKSYAGAWPGAYPLVGTPDDIVDDIVKMSAAGLAGTAVAFLDYKAEMPYFLAEVLPRLEKKGLRQTGH